MFDSIIQFLMGLLGISGTTTQGKRAGDKLDSAEAESLGKINDAAISAGSKSKHGKVSHTEQKEIDKLYSEIFNKLKTSSTKQTFAKGGVYTFIYDPKYKLELEYYDVFPLVLILNITKDHFLGLNLHYIPPKLRLLLISKILHRFSSLRNVTYDKLQTTNIREYIPCIKLYLKSHVRSRIIQIEDQFLAQILLDSVPEFKKAQTLKVWRDSINMIKKNQRML